MNPDDHWRLPDWRTPLRVALIAIAVLLAECWYVAGVGPAEDDAPLGAQAVRWFVARTFGWGYIGCSEPIGISLVRRDDGYRWVPVREREPGEVEITAYLVRQNGARGLWAGEIKRDVWALRFYPEPEQRETAALYEAFVREMKNKGLVITFPPEFSSGPIDRWSIDWIGVGHGLVALGALYALGRSLRLAFVRVLELRAALKGFCSSCGYSLRGLEQKPCCPECGQRKAA